MCARVAFVAVAEFNVIHVNLRVYRFWLMDCQNIGEASKMATDLYREAILVPFMSKFVVFAKRHEPTEATVRVFCVTDDKVDKTLESQEHFTEIARSRDVEVTTVLLSCFVMYYKIHTNTAVNIPLSFMANDDFLFFCCDRGL